MKFKIYVSTASSNKHIKDKCCEVLAKLLDKYGYYSIGYRPDEIDIDNIGRA